MCPVLSIILEDSRRKVGNGYGRDGGMEIEAGVSGCPMDSESIAWDRDAEEKKSQARDPVLSS